MVKLNQPIEGFSPHVWFVTLPAHLMAFASIYFLVTSSSSFPNWWIYLLTGWVFISGYGVAIGFHRLLSHNSFKVSRAIRLTLAYLGCLGGQGSPIFWAALHRGLHHPYSDTAKDLHSPIHGWWTAYFGWQIKFRPEQLPFRAALDLQRDRGLLFLHRNYYYVIWGSVLVAAILSPEFALFGLVVPMVLAIHTENAVNLFCHVPKMGYRNFLLDDNSQNIWWLGYFGFGQGWHNNHHAHPERSNYGRVKWFEWDPTTPLIAMIRERSKTFRYFPDKEDIHAPL